MQDARLFLTLMADGGSFEFEPRQRRTKPAPTPSTGGTTIVMGPVNRNVARFPIGFDRWYGRLSIVLGLPPSAAYVVVHDVEIEVRMGWAFRARFPRSAVASTSMLDIRPRSRGVHGFGRRWLVNGSGQGIVEIRLSPAQRAYVIGVPVRLRELLVSVTDSRALVAALSPVFDRKSPARRVLFVCAGNTCRSPMAAAVTRALLGAAVEAESAGMSAHDGAAATPEAVQVMEERGVDITRHRSRSFSALRTSDFDLVVALTRAIAQDIRRAGVEPSKIVTLNIPDPYGKGLEVYRTTVIAIEREVARLFAEAL